jgi:hypothetical protein
VVNLLDCVNVESAARRGRGSRERLWLCWLLCATAGCREILSLAKGLNSVLPRPRAQRLAFRKEEGWGKLGK